MSIETIIYAAICFAVVAAVNYTGRQTIRKHI